MAQGTDEVALRRADLRRALWSLHFHAEGEQPVAVPPALRPVSAFAALDMLFRQSDAHAAERRHWVLAHLQRSNLKPIRRSPADPSPGAAFQQFLQEPPRGPDRGVVRVQDLRMAPLPKVPQTTPPRFQCKTHYDEPNRIVSLKATAEVHRPVAGLRTVLDPRGWGKCSPFFDPHKTFRIKCDERTHLPMRGPDGAFLRDDQPALGEPWSGLLHERFDGQGFAYENILAIDFKVEGHEVRTDYSLFSCERFILGLFSERGVLRKNSGSMIAKPARGAGQVSQVIVTKRLRFRDLTPGDPGEWIDYGDSWGTWAKVLLCVQAQDKVVFNLLCHP